MHDAVLDLSEFPYIRCEILLSRDALTPARMRPITVDQDKKIQDGHRWNHMFIDRIQRVQLADLVHDLTRAGFGVADAAYCVRGEETHVYLTFYRKVRWNGEPDLNNLFQGIAETVSVLTDAHNCLWFVVDRSREYTRPYNRIRIHEGGRLYQYNI